MPPNRMPSTLSRAGIAALALLVPAPLGAQSDHRIWGRVFTADGEVHEGFIQLRRSGGGASWADVLMASREIPEAHYRDWLDATRGGEPVVLAVGTDRQFQALCEVLGVPDAAGDERFRTNPQRVVHRDALNTLLAHRIGQRDRASLLAALQARNVPAGAVRRLDEVLAQESVAPLRLRGRKGDGEAIDGLRSIAFESDAVSPPPELKAPPEFNRDRRYVLADVLGYTEDRVEGLIRAGAVL